MFFSSDTSKATLDRVLAMHFVRSGREDVEKVFSKVSGNVQTAIAPFLDPKQPTLTDNTGIGCGDTKGDSRAICYSTSSD